MGDGVVAMPPQGTPWGICPPTPPQGTPVAFSLCYTVVELARKVVSGAWMCGTHDRGRQYANHFQPIYIILLFYHLWT